MDPRRQSVPEAGAYRMVQGAFIELQGGRAPLDAHPAGRA